MESPFIDINEAENTKNIKEGTRMTSVNLSIDDWNFCKQHNLKFSTLLQDRVAQLRAIESGAIVENVQEERRKKEVFMEKFNKALEYLETKGLTHEFADNFLNE